MKHDLDDFSNSPIGCAIAIAIVIIALAFLLGCRPPATELTPSAAKIQVGFADYIYIYEVEIDGVNYLVARHGETIAIIPKVVKYEN